ncbi:MAG: MBL fold metallo-hydrolase [Methylococcales bacterium]|nr:MBL fold metallo-hydrolase [Methylococcales bacterium]
MQLIFRGVRGSIPTPGSDTVVYGGNTTCIQLGHDPDELLILDAGTGIYALARQLDLSRRYRAHIFITHTHWDHIHGLPFFTPIFIPGNEVHLYGGRDPVTGEGIERCLRAQLQYSYFPIREAELKARLSYHTIPPREAVRIGAFTITPIVLNHPVLNYGYRVEHQGRSLFFTGDYEPPVNIYAPDDPSYAEHQGHIDEQGLAVDSAIAGVDALIVDSSYTDSEYQQGKQGWGHGTYQSALRMAYQGRVKNLFFTHHEPTRSDRQLDSIFADLKQRHAAAPFRMIMAREEQNYQLD